MKLNDPTLLQQLAYIDGQWVPADSGATLPVTNPATGALLGSVPNMGAAETRRAIAAAAAAMPAWAAKTAKERATVLRRWHDLMMANQEDLAVLMTAEQGKPLTEARGEVAYAASFPSVRPVAWASLPSWSASPAAKSVCRRAGATTVARRIGWRQRAAAIKAI